MELDEMKLAWRTLDHRLNQQQALSLQLLRDSRLDKLRRGLRPLVWGQSLQILIGLVFAVWAVTFWLRHLHVLHLLVCGLVMQGFGLLMIVSAARVLELIRRLNYAAPVTVIQHQLADLRAWRVRIEAPVNVGVGCFIWIPALVMSLATHGIDVWNAGMAWWAVSSALVGLGATALVVWLMRRFGFGHKLEAHAEGNSVQKAQAGLDEIARFERES